MRASHRAGDGFWPLHPAAVWPERPAAQNRPKRTPGARRWRRPGLIVAATALAVLAADGAFGVTLTETYLEVQVRDIYPDSRPTLIFRDELTFAEGETIDGSAELSRLFSTGYGAQYPREPNNIEDDFASSELDAYGNYGVGASGIMFAAATRIAEATFSRSYRNDGTAPELLQIGFSIPGMEASVAGAPLLEDITARASALAFYEVRNADDRVVNEGDLFDYWLEASKAPANWDGEFEVGWQWSDDLDALFGAGVDLGFEEESYGFHQATSLTVSPFNSHFVYDALNPGETVTFMLFGEARLAVGGGGIEGGGQALVGDPFDLRVPQGPVFNFTVDGSGEVPVVPVPAAAWLLLSALLPILALGRGRSAGQRGPV